MKIVRTFDAPRHVVWKAWTDPAQVAQWWGPRGFTNPVCEWDARPGGRMHVVMRASDEIARMIGRADHPMTGEFTEVVPVERLAFVSTAVDDAGKPLLESLTTVRFVERGDKTEMVLHARAKGFVEIAAQMLQGMEAGWTQSIDKLEEHIGAASDTPEFAISRSFNAPREAVWKAYSQIERALQMVGTARFRVARRARSISSRAGCSITACGRPAARRCGGSSSIARSRRPSRMVFVTSFSDPERNTMRAPFAADWPLEVLNVMTLTEQDGVTTVALRGSPLNATEAEKKRFEAMKPSMNQGFSGTFDQLEGYLANA